MVECLARPEQQVAETVLDYFNALDYVLMAERDPQLRAPLYAQLLLHLLRHAQYPAGFTSWEQHVEDDRDEESFKRFRWGLDLSSSIHPIPWTKTPELNLSLIIDSSISCWNFSPRIRREYTPLSPCNLRMKPSTGDREEQRNTNQY